MNISEKAKKTIRKLTSFSNNALLSVPLDALSTLFPCKQKGEDAKRKADRAKLWAGELGAAVKKEPALVNGHLNRNKILIGTTAFYADEHFTETDVKRIADGGFDFLITVDDRAFAKKLLDNCEKYSVAVIAKDTSLPSGPQIIHTDLDSPALFANYQKHPAQVGDMGWDESNVKDFEYIGKFYKRYKEALPEQFLFNNLFPGCAMKSQTGAKSYRDYIERFSAAVPGDYIATDIYPFHPLALMNKFSMMFCLHTYHTLGDVCRRDGKDFWLYLQTQGMWYSHVYALPTAELIRWQCWTALCYGARSLIHVAYTPVWDTDAYAMLDHQGRLTEQYLYAKKTNAELQRLSEVLSQYRCLGVIPATAKRENPHFLLAVQKQRNNNRVQGFSGIPFIKAVRSESTALAGYFKNPSTGKLALLLVNCKNLYDERASQKIWVDFATPADVKVYAHGSLRMSGTVSNGLELIVGSCDGVFVEFDKTNDA